MKNRILSALLTLCMALTLLAVTAITAAAADVTADNSTFASALTQANASGGTITLSDDVTLAETAKITGNVTLNLNGHNVTYTGSTGSVFWVDKGTFILCGNGQITGGKGKLPPNVINTTYGGCVYVSGGTFSMDGGTLVGNTANNGGGVYIAENGLFVMNDGSIETNNVPGNGGGVYVDDGTFTMNRGFIQSNEARCGGGVYIHNHGTFRMENGSIINNRTTSDYSDDNGGGVYVWSGTFIMHDGIIKGNTSGSGGGVGVIGGSDAEFNMTGGTIEGNIAKYQGGGVSASGPFNMSGGTICNNISLYSGGGVFFGDSFNMSGGNITGNIAVEKNGGVAGMFGDDKFRLSGSVNITNNTVNGSASNVCFISESDYIIVTDNLSADAKIGVSPVDYLNNAKFATGVAAGDEKKFVSDRAIYRIEADGTGNLNLVRTSENPTSKSGIFGALSWTLTKQDLTLSGSIPAGEHVYVAQYDRKDNLLSVAEITGNGGSVSIDCTNIKLFWTTDNYAPKCPKIIISRSFI